MFENEKEFKILATSYGRSFKSKEEAMKNIGEIQTYIDEAHLNSRKHNYCNQGSFIGLLENKVPFALGSWLESERSRVEIKGYQTTVYMFNLNDLSSISPRHYNEVYWSLLKGPFKYIQESHSSGKLINEKKFHLYLPVTELKGVDFDIQQIIYEQVRAALEMKLGLQFDESFYLHKNIIPSGKTVQVNHHAPIFDLQPYLNDITRIGRIYNKKLKDDYIRDYDVSLTKAFYSNITSTLNYAELLNALKTEGLVEKLSYKDKMYMLMALNTMESEQQISQEQKLELIEVLGNE